MHQTEAKLYILPLNAVRSFFKPFFPCPDLNEGSDLLDHLHYSDQNKKNKEKLLKYMYTPLFAVWC